MGDFRKWCLVAFAALILFSSVALPQALTADVKTAADKALDSKYIFKAYANQAEWSAAHEGKPCPWDPAKRPKYWEDASAAAGAEDEGVTYLVLSINAQNGDPNQNALGAPTLRTLTLLSPVAATVNIPPPMASEFKYAAAYPVPLAPLAPNEALIFDKLSFGKQVLVRDMTKYAALQVQANETATNFTPADRDLLRKIAAKLGVQ